jgi:hypothetical protein
MGKPWRAVEAQHVISTLALVDTLQEQALLEQLLEASKPPVPADAQHLHYLLATPFRYPPSQHGSRFRAPHALGVYYATEEIRTACAELGYWRWKFLMDSTLEVIPSISQSVFQSSIAATVIDLRTDPFVVDRHVWTDPHSHLCCQEFGALVRQAGVEGILYESVRDPQHGQCVALFQVRGFRSAAPLELQTWSLAVSRSRVFWQRQSAITPASFEFDFNDSRSGDDPVTRNR